MLKKANKKRELDNIVIQDGNFNTDFFRKVHWKDWLDEDKAGKDQADGLFEHLDNFESALQGVEDEADVLALKKARKELQVVDRVDFTEKAVEEEVEREQVCKDGVEAFMLQFVLNEWGWQNYIKLDELLEGV